MALLRCPDCEKEYSSRLDACPKCYAPASCGIPVSSAPFPARANPNATVVGWLEGMRLKDKYELVQKLGRGSFGEVWKAKDLEAEVFVALKLLPPELSGSPAEVVRVRKNFQQVHALHHQHIMSHLAMFQDAEECALVMELVDGTTLGEYRLDYEEKHGGFPLEEALRICRQIAEGLDFAHAHKVAHRDVKPDNVMVTATGGVKLLDFGLAAEIRSSMSRVSRQLHDTSGTRPYMSPEQWQAKAPGSASDQYALGVVLYELLSGRLPFESDDPAVLRECVLHDTPASLPSLPPPQNAALLKAMAKTPEERFPTCTEFIDAVANILKAAAPSPQQNTNPEHEEKMRAWVNEQPIKLGERLAEEFYIDDDDNLNLPEGSSLMAFAALEGRSDVLEWLRANGEDADARNICGETPMHIAALHGRVPAMEWLKENGADINAPSDSGKTPIQYAAMGGRVAALRWFKENGADMNSKDANGETLMHSAALLGRVAAMKWLKENGADVNSLDSHGVTPMHNAAVGGATAAMEWLKENGAEINAKTDDGKTPLDFTEDGSHARDWLVENGGRSGAELYDEMYAQMKGQLAKLGENLSKRHNSREITPFVAHDRTKKKCRPG